MHIERIIKEVVRIPPAPQILPRLQALLRDPCSDLEDIDRLLKVDISITTEILRLSNSSYFNFANPVTSLEQAISLMGFRQVYKIVSIAAAGGALKDALPFYNADEGEFLDHSVATAVIMSSLADAGGMSQSDSHYTIGLLHGIGKIVINKYFLSRGLSVFGKNAPNGEEAHDISLDEERQIFGFDHTEAGAALLNEWGFAQDIVRPIRYQYAPEEAGDAADTAASLKLSRENATRLINGNHAPGEWIFPDKIGVVQCDKFMSEEIVESSRKRYAEFHHLLRNSGSGACEDIAV